jgi:kinesin family protein C1
VAATDKNLESSRSHSVFTMHLVGRNPARGRTAELVGSLSLCDLAGSERLKTSHAQDERLKETQAINTSLSALSTVFTSLAQKAAHVPFRNSALTHLLSPCLSGDGKTFMIVNLSADHCDAAESLCSLRFAQTVNRTELGRAKKNVREGAAAPPPPPPAGKDASRARVNSMQ